MEGIGHIGHPTLADPLVRAQTDSPGQRGEPPTAGTDATTGDHAEISDMGRLLAATHDRPDVRLDRVAAMREAIANDPGRFIAERLGGTIDRLLQDLSSV